MRYQYLFKKIYLTIFFIFMLTAVVSAQGIRGKVTDAKTGEPLTGATVMLEGGGAKQLTSAKLDGSYNFKKVSTGSYNISAKFIGYSTSQIFKVTVNSSAQVVIVNIPLQDASKQISEVVISGKSDKETDRSARGIEKNSNTILNVLSSNTIQLLPDVTVGNALQRVSGVTIQRSNNGEGRYAIVRGMDQRYNSTLVNGIKIPSPDPAYRFVPMDIFPSEMLERLEVIKALTPSMEGDAIGGVMNMVMKSAPDHFVLSANVSGGFSNLFSAKRPFVAFNSSPNGKSPAAINGNNYQSTYADYNNTALTSDKNLSAPFSLTAGLTIGDRFLNNKLGVVLSASYQNIYRGSDSKRLNPNAQPNATPLPNTPQFSDAYDRTYSTQTERLGLHNKIDYIFNSKNKLSLYNLYIHQDEYESRYTADTSGIGTNSNALSKQINLSNRSTLTRQDIYNGTLHGDHLLTNNLRFNWDGVYSIAKRNMPDRSEYSYDANESFNTAGALTAEIDNKATLIHHWENNTDRDLSGYGNFIYNQTIFGKNVEFSLGGLYRHKDRDAEYITFSLNSPSFSTNFNSLPFVFTPLSTGVGANSSDLQNNYTFKEDDNAEYLQVKFNPIPKLQILGGVRVENTLQSYETQSPLTVKYRAGTVAYTDVLPSVHLKYELTDNQSLRASYFASLSRPGFGEIVPYKVSGDYYDQEGNPFLKHITADNFDLRYELFPGGADQLLVGTFYKKIHNPIEYFVQRDGSGPSSQAIIPQNDDGDAKNFGLELLATKFFGVLGFSVNYTYTHSRITTAKLLYYQDPNPAIGLQQNFVDQTRPLQGQADNVGNVSILFKSAKLGLDMQVAFVYTGERLAQASPYANLDFYQHAYNQLDFSFEKTMVKRLSFFGKINNLTNTASKIYLKYPNANITPTQQEFLGKQDIAAQTLVQSDYYKTLFLGGFRYKF